MWGRKKTAPAKTFSDVATMDELDGCFERSHDETVVLFLHDYWCPVSTRAYDEMCQVEGDVALVDVAEHRDLTASITQRTGVKHESPQVLILRDGASRWDASHFKVTADAVRDAVSEV